MPSESKQSLHHIAVLRAPAPALLIIYLILRPVDPKYTNMRSSSCQNPGSKPDPLFFFYFFSIDARSGSNRWDLCQIRIQIWVHPIKGPIYKYTTWFLPGPNVLTSPHVRHILHACLKQQVLKNVRFSCWRCVDTVFLNFLLQRLESKYSSNPSEFNHLYSMVRAEIEAKTAKDSSSGLLWLTR